LFKESKNNTYCHTKLNRAIELGLEMELLDDTIPNFINYEGCLMNGAKLFRPFIDYLFQFKKDGIKEIKKIFKYIYWYVIRKK